MAVNQKRTHFGRAGEFFAMSEILLRGWNVAVPVVDVGDDVFVIDDNDKTTLRVQVKSTRVTLNEKTAVRSAKFTLSRQQLRADLVIKLVYVFVIRDQEDARWRFLAVPRDCLDDIHQRYLVGPHPRGALPKTDSKAMSDALALEITFLEEGPRAWGTSLTEFFERWPEMLPSIESGPGSVRGGRVRERRVVE